MVEFGPIHMIVLGFPDIGKLKGEALKEVFRLSDAGIIRIIGLLAIAKDKNGKVEAAHLTDLSYEDRVKLGAGIGALIGFGAAGIEGAKAGAEAGAIRIAEKEDIGLSKEKVMDIAKEIPNGTAACILLFEHLWAKKLKEIAIKVDGVVLAQGIIEPRALVALGAELAEGANAAEKVKIK
ncbi:MAG: DUF1269 domain-containing protein [Methanotrichaceae archaeon]|nr:DUF1269 domain-containing protein [Methanotrichaceae archaeon]